MSINIKKPTRASQSKSVEKGLFDDADIVDGPRRERPFPRAEPRTPKTPKLSDSEPIEPVASGRNRRAFPKEEPIKSVSQSATSSEPKRLDGFYSKPPVMRHLSTHTQSLWMKDVVLSSVSDIGPTSHYELSWSGTSASIPPLLAKRLDDPTAACLVTKLRLRSTIDPKNAADCVKWRDMEDLFDTIRLKLGGDDVFSMGFHDGTVSSLCLYHPEKSCFLNSECSVIGDTIEFSFDLPIPFFKFASLPIGKSTTLTLDTVVNRDVVLRSVTLFADIQITDIVIDTVSTLYWPTISSIISTNGFSTEGKESASYVLQFGIPVTALIVVLDIQDRHPTPNGRMLSPADGSATFQYDNTDIQTVDFVRTPSRDNNYYALIPFSPDWNSSRAPYFHINDGIIKISFGQSARRTNNESYSDADDDADILDSVLEGEVSRLDASKVREQGGIRYRISIVAVKPLSLSRRSDGSFFRQ